jgi:hypothetical protein
MYIVCFNSIFSENAFILSKRLNINIVTEFNPTNNDIVIIFGAHQYEISYKLVEIQKNVNVEYIIIQTEQYNGKAFDNKYYLELLENNCILDWSKENIKKLKKHMPQLPVYSLYFYDFIVQENLPEFNSRPIDFFFCGAYSKEREILLNDFKFKNSNYNIEIDLSYSYADQNAYSEKLKKVKYVLNIPYYKDSVLETQRINKALFMGCNVVSLFSSDQDLNETYYKYIYFVQKLNDFTLLIEQEPRESFVHFIQNVALYKISLNLTGLLYAEKKLKEKLKLKELSNVNPSV